MKYLSKESLGNYIKVVWAAPLIIAVLVYASYEIVSMIFESNFFPEIKKSSFNTLISIISAYSVTMTGFIAAIGAYISSISHKPSYTEWREARYDKVFYHLYASTIIVLLFIFSESIFMLLIGHSLTLLKAILLSLIASMAQIIFLTVIIINQSKRAQS